MNHKKHLYTVLCILMVMVLSGCGSKHYDLARSTFMTGFNGKGRVAIAVKDQRPFVINGEKETTYIGRYPGIHGIPKPILTRSGRSVADDLSELIAGAMSENGFQTESVYLNTQDTLPLESDKFPFAMYDRTVLLVIDDLWHDLSVTAELRWSFNLEIYDERGVLCAQKQHQGGTTFGNRRRSAFQDKVGGILMEMFGSPDVMTALTFESDGNTIGTTVETSKQAIETVSDIGADRPETVSVLERYLRNGEITSFRYYARQVGGKASKDQQVLDGLAEIIWREKENDNKYIIDGLCHLCRTFLLSRQPRYKSFFEWLNENGSSYKLRRYARKTSKYIITAGVPQFQPWKVEEQVKETPRAIAISTIAGTGARPPAVVPDQKIDDVKTTPQPDSQIAEKENIQGSDGPEKKILLSIYIDELGYDGVGDDAHTRSNVSLIFNMQQADAAFEQEALDSGTDKNEFHQRVISEVNRNLKDKSVMPVKLYMNGRVLEKLNRNSINNDVASCSLTEAADLLFDKILMMFMSVDSPDSPFDLEINIVAFGNGAIVGKHLLNLLSGVNTDLGKSQISFHSAVFFDPVISVKQLNIKYCRNLLVHYPKIAEDGQEIIEYIASNADRKKYPLVIYKTSQAERKMIPGGHK